MERAGDEKDRAQDDLLPSLRRVTCFQQLTDAKPEHDSADDEEDESDSDSLVRDLDTEVSIRRRVMMKPPAVGLHRLPIHRLLEWRFLLPITPLLLLFTLC